MDETEKEMQLRKIEIKLAEKYTPTAFRDRLEGPTIKMEPVDIIIDESIPKSKYQNLQLFPEMSP